MLNVIGLAVVVIVIQWIFLGTARAERRDLQRKLMIAQTSRNAWKVMYHKAQQTRVLTPRTPRQKPVHPQLQVKPAELAEGTAHS